MVKNLENEEWKDILNYEGLYQISNLGRVKSLERKVEYINKSKYKKEYKTTKTYEEKLIQQYMNESGYMRVHLSKNGKSKFHFVHRLVAQGFIDNPENLPEVNHKDENTINNSVKNLEWCDRLYNANYDTRPQRCGKHNKKKVICITTGEIFNSIKEASKKYNCDESGLGKACAGKKYKTYKGMKWSFYEDNTEVNN